VTLASFWDRYLSPAIFIGSIFTAFLLYELTYHFNLKAVIQQASKLFSARDRTSLRAFIGLAVIAFALPVVLNHTVVYLYKLYSNPGTPVSEVTQYLESITGENDLIETYESELFFLLDRRYHYPPDEIDVEVIAKTSLFDSTPYSYDPLEADPDYLVIGHFAGLSAIYEPVITSGEFESIKTFSNYEVYARVR